MTRPALIFAATLLGLVSVQAQPVYPIHIERQYGRNLIKQKLIIDHSPPGGIVPARISRATVLVKRIHRPRVAAVHKMRRKRVVKQRWWVQNPRLAGGCRDGGYVTAIVRGAPVTLHRDICIGIAPIDSRRWLRQYSYSVAYY